MSTLRRTHQNTSRRFSIKDAAMNRPTTPTFRLLTLAAAVGMASMLPAEEAAAETWEYCVKNLGSASSLSFGINKLPGKLGFVSEETDTKRCASTLRIDHTANTALLEGVAQDANGGRVDVRLEFTGMQSCTKGTLSKWLQAWGVVLPAFPVPQSEAPLGWQCFDGVSGTIGAQAVDNAPAFGAIRMKNNPGVDLGGFTLEVGENAKHWLLAFKLFDGMMLDPPRRFEIGACFGNRDGTEPVVVDWYGDGTLLTTFNNEPELCGVATVQGIYEIPDPREHCGGDENFAAGGNYQLNRIPAGTTRPEDGLRITLASGTGSLEVPWHLCGIVPAGQERPVIRILNVAADFQSLEGHPEFRDVINSVVEHEAANPSDPDYVCDADTGNGLKDPVVAWLPRTDEIPIYAATPAGILQKTRQVRDVTSGCGSARGGTSTRSYLAHNLRHWDGVTAELMDGIIGSELAALDITLRQPGQCLDPDDDSILTSLFSDWDGDAVAGGGSFMKLLRDAYRADDFEGVVAKLEWLLDELGEGGRLFAAYDTCYYKGKLVNLPGYPALDGFYPAAPELPGYVPRNFRGDLEAQVEHLIWNIEQKLPAP
jgi:hypothetical protein